MITLYNFEESGHVFKLTLQNNFIRWILIYLFYFVFIILLNNSTPQISTIHLIFGKIKFIII